MGFRLTKRLSGIFLAGVVMATATLAMSKPAWLTDDPSVGSSDATGVDVNALIDAMLGTPSTTPPSDWTPPPAGPSSIPGILIRPPGGDPIVVPEGPSEPAWWSPWQFPRGWVPGGYPYYRIPGTIVWNPEEGRWEFHAPGLPPIPLAGTVIDLRADFNNDGVVDFFDYLDFLDAFSEGSGS